ncbi:MAG: hypothetical protein D6704_12490, partial [Nitrospirae bacterium]
SLHDPSIRSLPLESFQAGLTGLAKLAFDVLKNTITLPAKLLTPQSAESDSSHPRSSLTPSASDAERDSQSRQGENQPALP